MKIKQFLVLFTLLILAGCQHQKTSADDTAISDQDLREMTAKQILPLLKSGEVLVSDYVEVLLAHTKEYDAVLNAFITHDPQVVRDHARAADAKRTSGAELGPLFGIPVSLKDLIATKDMVTTFGTSKFAGFTPKKKC